MMNPASRHRPSVLEAALLAGLLVYLGIQIVPAHWTSIWLDREFTGWQTPVANRMAEGLQLYADTAHSPMPPLSFVVLRWLTGGEGGWLAENGINFVTQGLMVLLLYWGLAAYLPRPVPFLSALGALAAFLSFGKTVYYDQLAQFLVAALAVVTVGVVEPGGLGRAGPGPGSTGGRTPYARFAAMGLLSALAVLTKQNTGGGASIGALICLLIFPAELPWRGRLKNAAVYLTACAGFFFLAIAALSPWISVRGLIVDVFLTGSEPKGGPGTLFVVLGKFGLSTLLASLMVGAPGGLLLYYRHRSRSADASARAGRSTEAARLGLPHIWMLSGAGLAGAGICFGFYQIEGLHLLRPYVGEALLTLGLGASLFIAILYRWFRQFLPAQFHSGAGAIAAFAVVLLPPAMLHTLSVSEFRWTVDNNPMIALALASLLTGAVWMAGPGAALPGRMVGLGALIFMIEISLFGGLAGQLNATSYCTERWPEIAHLRGARLRENAREMRSLIQRVRELAPDEQRDQVLLLPGDPNVEAWFERPEPALTSLIIFQDQYWDRYVEEDYRRLAADPPKVIVIGPRDAWPGFFDLWQKGKGASRLIGRIERELIPLRYDHVAGHPILFAGILEHMDVYVRRDAPAPPAG